MRQVRVLPTHLVRVCQPGRSRDRCREQPRRGRRPRPARAGDVCRKRAGPVQGLHHRRGAHAHAGGVERAPQDPGGAAARRGIRVRHHRAAEDRQYGCAGPEPAAAVRLPATGAARDHRAAAVCGGAGGRGGRERRVPDHRPCGARRHARRSIDAGPGAGVRRGRGDRGPRAGRPGAHRRRALRRAVGPGSRAAHAGRVPVRGAPGGGWRRPGGVRGRCGRGVAGAPGAHPGW